MKTEELFIERAFNWVFVDNKKRLFLICLIVYLIILVVFTPLVFHHGGGVASVFNDLNTYPEQDYQQLEDEIQNIQNIIVEGKGISPENLSNKNISYDISYHTSSTSEGEYEIKLSYNRAEVRCEIGKDCKKENIKIERNFETVSEYRRSEYFSFFATLLLFPFMLVTSLLLLYILFLLITLPLSLLIRAIKRSKK